MWNWEQLLLDPLCKCIYIFLGGTKDDTGSVRMQMCFGVRIDGSVVHVDAIENYLKARPHVRIR